MHNENKNKISSQKEWEQTFEEEVKQKLKIKITKQ